MVYKLLSHRGSCIKIPQILSQRTCTCALRARCMNLRMRMHRDMWCAPSTCLRSDALWLLFLPLEKLTHTKRRKPEPTADPLALACTASVPHSSARPINTAHDSLRMARCTPYLLSRDVQRTVGGHELHLTAFPGLEDDVAGARKL